MKPNEYQIHALNSNNKCLRDERFVLNKAQIHTLPEKINEVLNSNADIVKVDLYGPYGKLSSTTKENL